MEYLLNILNREAIGKDGVCTNYSYDYVGKTWEFLKNFKGGNMIFTYPGFY